MNAKLKILQIALKQQFPIALLAVIMEINVHNVERISM